MAIPRIRVLLDVSPITPRPELRTGLARVALCLAQGLAADPGIDLSTCAWGSLRASRDFADVARQFPEIHATVPRTGVLEHWHERVRRAADAAGGSAAAVAHRLGQAINVVRNPLRGVDLAAFDVVHSTYARFPRVVRRAGRPTLLTLHDLTPLRLSEKMIDSAQRAITSRIVASIRPTDWVACVSEFTRHDFLAWCDHPPERVVAIPNGVDADAFGASAVPSDLADVRRRFGLGDAPFALTLSSLAAHKNLALLLRIWPDVRRSLGTPATLVVAGGKSADASSVRRSLGIGSEDTSIVTTGFVSDADFRGLAAATNAFLFPSLYEGFGLPVLEAMAAGAPVIVSNRTSVPEVVGAAGTLIDPADQTAWTAAVAAALAQPPRTSPHAASVARAREFSWERTVAGYRSLYERMVAASA